MYKNYYKILNVNHEATKGQIKAQYRILAKKWHPDVNASEHANSTMQEITEAYLILSDDDARRRYDILYQKIFNGNKVNESDFTEKDFNINQNNEADTILTDWIDKAKQQAKEYVSQSLKDAKGITLRGCAYSVKAIGVTVLLFLLLLIILNIDRCASIKKDSGLSPRSCPYHNGTNT